MSLRYFVNMVLEYGLKKVQISLCLDVKFAFAHIDGDEIPELIVSDFRAYQKEQREDRKIFALSIYTYKEDQAVTVLKDARSDNGIIEFYCYNPYSGSLCHYQTPDFGDASVPAYILKRTFMDEYIEGREGNWVLYRYSTPNWVLAGKDSAAEAVSFLKSGSIPQDTEYELHPKYEPYTDEYYASLPTLPPDETEPYAPDSSKISDYSKYYGNYKGCNYHSIWSNRYPRRKRIRICFERRNKK